MNDNLNIWSNAHVFYSKYNQTHKNNSSPEDITEYINRRDLLSSSKNYNLLNDNSFFYNLKHNTKYYFAHITYGIDQLIASKSIYASGGCLVGSLYCVPLTLDSRGLRLHNLGEYIYEEEAMALGHKNYLPEIVVIEVEAPINQNSFIGIDYLRLGEIHKRIFLSLEYLLSKNERYELQNSITQKIRNSLDFLSLCANIYYRGYKVNSRVFLQYFNETQKYLPILGYLYFEVLAEYIMLFQDNKISQLYSDQGEFYNKSYKKMMYELEPRLRMNFKLSEFAANIKDVSNYLKNSKLFSKFVEVEFNEYVYKRLLDLIISRLITNSQYVEWEGLEWRFSTLLEDFGGLVGHLIHRELRNFGRFPSLYFYFDQTKALQIWNYWNHTDTVIPFNGLIPKGEIGINPAYPDLVYKIYRGKPRKEGMFTYVDTDNELDIRLQPKLVDLKHTVMRDKYQYRSEAKSLLEVPKYATSVNL